MQAAETDAADASTKRPVDEGTASRNANDVLLLRTKLQSLEERSDRAFLLFANKSVLETEKERDKLHKELEFIEVQMQGKRTHTHDDTGDGYDMYTQVDEWDLRDFLRGTTRVQTVGTWNSGLSTEVGGVQGHEVLRRGHSPRR